MTPIDETAEKIGVCHETAFTMRHKLLAYMESMTESLALLDELVEADETYVLESQKGITCVDRKPRKHGEGASKRGLSNELYCVCVATDRNDNLVATCVNRAKPSGDDLGARGYRLKIFDAYRPQMAVTHFMNWALDPEDARMKEYFYPELEKDQLFPQGYIAEHSGHSRGSTVDLTLFDMTTEKEVDMGGTFDYFGERSHPDYTGITEEQLQNRMILREAMLAHGFRPLAEEWWHFTLEEEPYPDTYFTFPINSSSLEHAALDQAA